VSNLRKSTGRRFRWIGLAHHADVGERKLFAMPPAGDQPDPVRKLGRFDRGPAPRDDAGLLHRAIVAAKADDVDALRFLYVRFADDVCRYVQTIVGERHSAEDVTQTLFSQLTTKMRNYEPRAVPFKGWLFRVAHNAAVDHVRARRVIPFEEVRARDVRFDESGIERGRSLRLALERLSPDQREVLVLRHIAGLTPPEIAGRLNKSESAIHGLHHRARHALKAALLELDAGPMTAPGRSG
jgi:RNA polymerase sigma-70 factor, ECF subfamily